MNTQSPYSDVEIPEISLPRFILDPVGERGTAVPLMGPADPGSAIPLMGPATAGSSTPLMGPPAPATVTPLMGPADRGTMVSLMGPADPGTATPLMRPSRQCLAQTARSDVWPGPAPSALRPGRPQGDRCQTGRPGADPARCSQRTPAS